MISQICSMKYFHKDISKCEISIKAMAKPVPALKLNFSHLWAKSWQTGKSKQVTSLLGLKQVGDFLKGDDDDDDKV
jgi:hypothetical protein